MGRADVREAVDRVVERDLLVRRHRPRRVRVPASWRLLYKSGDQWLPVETTSAYGVARNAWNTVAFTPVTTTALRIELSMQPGFSAGLQEWKVNRL